MNEDINKVLGDMYSKAVKELNEEEQGIRPFRCGWYKRKVEEHRARMEGKEYVPDDENMSDDEHVVIILNDGREFEGTRGESKKWLEENGITSTKS